MPRFTQSDLDAFLARRNAAKPKISPESAKPEKQGSRLEERFLELWQAVQGPPLEREFRFYPARKWRGDFVHVASRTIYELDGMVWNGGHTRGDGYTRDRQRDFEAHCVGWTVVRLVEPLLTKENILALAMRAHVNSPVKSPFPTI